MKNRTVKITVIVAAVLVIGLFGYFILLPRIILYNTVQKSMEFFIYIDIKAEYFTDFSITHNGDVQTINNGFVSIKIPADYKQDEKKYAYANVYRAADDRNYAVMFFNEPYEYTLNLIDPEMFADMEGVSADWAADKIAMGFKKLGHGLPDSTYKTYKCMLLTDRNDYSFWDIKKGTCFMVTAALKEILLNTSLSADYEYQEYYLYERDDMCAMIRLEKVDYGYDAVFEIYNVNDLNRGHTFIIYAQSLDDVWAIVNSAEFIDETTATTL